MDLGYLEGPKPDVFKFDLTKTCVIIVSTEMFPFAKPEYGVYLGVLR
jgi:hypothetical protein